MSSESAMLARDRPPGLAARCSRMSRPRSSAVVMDQGFLGGAVRSRDASFSYYRTSFQFGMRPLPPSQNAPQRCRTSAAHTIRRMETTMDDAMATPYAARPAGAHPATGMEGRAVAAATVGTALEWFDFTLYGAVAATILPKLFFPSLDPNSALLASLA